VHELGHAVALRIYHQRPRVVLHAFGGLTYGSAGYRSRRQSIIVSAAGPLTALVLLGLPAYAYFQTFDRLDQYFDYAKYVIVQDIAWVNIAWSIVNLLPILPLDGGNIASAMFGRAAARMTSIVVAFAAATYFFQQGNQFGGFFLMMFAIMNFASYQQEKAGQSPAVPAVPAASARRVPLHVPRPSGPAPSGGSDLFLKGSRALAEGRTAEGLDALAAAYAVRPSGPSNLFPAQQLARSGHAAPFAARLLQPDGAGPVAASSLQSHLHYADCFRESAEVGALVYADGRANRAQTAYEIACATARTGDNEQAMAWLARSIDDGFVAGSLLDGEPDLAPLRIRPEWSATRARVP
jgi:hypothetical protein